MTITALCLFCGTKAGADPAFADLATGLGTLVAGRGVTLVTGGTTDGLMGFAARAALAAGGRVVAVVPAGTAGTAACDPAPPGLTEHAVGAPRERQALMVARADAIVVLPGGIGTLDDLFGGMTAKSRAGDAPPIFLLDVAAGTFWRPLRDLLGHLDRAGFADPGLFALIEPLAGLDAFAARLDRQPPGAAHAERPGATPADAPR